MATRTSATLSTPGFVVDPASVTRSTGRQVDWAAVAAARQNAAGKKEIAPGTVVSLQANGKVVPRADVDDSGGAGTYDEAWGIIETGAVEDEPQAAKTGYGVMKGGILHENLLPDNSGGTLPAAYASELASNGCYFSFEPFEDSRLS